MLLCTAGWHCGYNRQEKWAKVLQRSSPYSLTNHGSGDPAGQHGGPLHGAVLPPGAGGVGPHQWTTDCDRTLCLDGGILPLDWVTFLYFPGEEEFIHSSLINGLVYQLDGLSSICPSYMYNVYAQIW